MQRYRQNGVRAAAPIDNVAHEEMIKYISELIVCDIQGNMSSEFLRQVHACKKSGLAPHEKAERMRLVRDMRKTLERLTEEMGQKFYEEYRDRPNVGRWYDTWLSNEPPQFLRWEQEWGFTPDESILTIDGHSFAGSIDGGSLYGAHRGAGNSKVVYREVVHTAEVDEDDGSYDVIENAGQTHYLDTVPEYNPNAVVTEKAQDQPAPSTSCCDCGSEEGPDGVLVAACRTGCVCSNQGFGCTARCGCDETCGNAFNTMALDHILGVNEEGKPVKSHPCFIGFVQRHDSASTLTLDYLFEHLLSALDVIPEGADEALDGWRVKWETTNVDGPDAMAQTEELQRQLLRLGLSNQRLGEGWFFSFCHPKEGRVGSWQCSERIWHCRDCENCNERREWHCENCNNCTFGLEVACGGCGGVSMAYHVEHNQ
ncbi:hypothetical protein F5Y16DRAFT_415388 [Xylariaceae sp. FL0255]|nr:hypothetical protein F5Y16DRAFT_415388 [Xylariaceae sp. FL0255]